MINDDSYYELMAKKAYRAYGDSTGWLTFSGQPMLTYDQLPDNIKDAWVAVARSLVPREPLRPEWF